MSAPGRQGPLRGVRVADLTQGVAGPYCTKLLADAGADVIKVEKPGGDPARFAAPFPSGGSPANGGGALFRHLNTNKRSVVLDLKTPAGRESLKGLVANSDIVVENYRPATARALGLDYATLAAAKPDLVMTSISAFGQDGPYRDFDAVNMTALAMGGLMHVTGDPNREPLMPGGLQAEYQGGLNGAVGTMAAWLHHNIHGTGQHVDVSVMECISANLESMLFMYTFMGAVRRRWYSRNITSLPSEIYRCKDGHVVVIGVRMLEDLDLLMETGGKLAGDPRFATMNGRFTNYEDFQAIMQPWLDEHTSAEIFERAQELRLPFALVPDMTDLLDNEHLAYRGFFVAIPGDEAGLRYPGAPFRLPASPLGLRTPAPALGADSAVVLDMVGRGRKG